VLGGRKPVAIAANDLSQPLRDDRTLFGRQFVGVRFVTRMLGKVLPQPRAIPLEAAESQMLVQSPHLLLRASDQILIAQLIET
jgi:hypothetical protein